MSLFFSRWSIVFVLLPLAKPVGNEGNEQEKDGKANHQKKETGIEQGGNGITAHQTQGAKKVAFRRISRNVSRNKDEGGITKTLLKQPMIPKIITLTSNRI